MIVEASNFGPFTAHGRGPKRATGTMLLLNFCIVTLRLSLAFMMSAIVQVEAQTNTLTVPRETADSFGDVGSHFFAGEIRVQQVYASSEFEQAPTDLISITGVAFRPNNIPAGSSLDVFIPSLTISMGTYRGSITDIPPRQFAANSKQIVFSGQSIQFKASGLGFGAKFIFDTPFLYDRREGQLTLDLQGGGESRLRSGGFDAQRVAEGRGLYSSLIIPAGADQLEWIFVTQFSYVSIPEPSVICLLALSGLWCIWRRPNG